MGHWKQWFEPGLFGIGQVGGIGVCLHTCSLSHPAAPLLPQFPNGLLHILNALQVQDRREIGPYGPI